MQTCACGCGNAVTQPRDGRPRYYLKGHSGEGRRIPATCARCATPVIVSAWRLTKFGKVYCGQACASLAKIRTATTPCAHCGAAVTYKPGSKQGARVFCGLSCVWAAHEAEPDRKIDVQCAGCQAALRVHPSKYRLNQHFYCNRACRAHHIAGPANPAYRSGFGRRLPYGPHWRSSRRAARLRDGNRCRVCRVPSQRPRDLEVHHITPLYQFAGDWEQADALSNLITLCRPCHRKAERGEVALQRQLAL